MKISIITETTGSLENIGPEGYFTYNGVEYPHWGNPNGRAKTIDYDVGKFNRYAKIGSMADELIGKFEDMTKSDRLSTKGRCAFACLVMMKYGITWLMVIIRLKSLIKLFRRMDRLLNSVR